MEGKPKVRAKAGQKAAESPADGGAGELVNMAQAIKLLKASRSTFYRWLREGKIKGIKVGRQWRLYRGDIERFLKGEGPRLDLPTDISPLVEELQRLAKQHGAVGFPGGDISVVQQVVRLMMLLGVVMKASDIHIQGNPGGVALLRYRVDGALREFARFDRRLLPAIIQEWKRMASCDVLEKVRPQNGRIGLSFSRLDGSESDRLIDLRPCFVPAAMGEAMTARILERPTKSFVLEELLYSPEVRQRILRALKLPWGVVLVTGPAGSGKTTTLYSCLIELNTADAKVMTVEDPVEYFIEGTVQISVNPKVGLTYPVALRSILQSDPDVIMIRGVGDAETLGLVLQAALGGHLVITALRTDEAASALKRIVDMGVDPFLVADATRLVLAQRLARRLCPDCSQKQNPAADRLKLAADVARKGGLDLQSLEQKFRKAVGCEKCGKTGYRGRIGIAEALEVTPEVAEALRNNASADEIRAIAVGQGMTTMAADGIRQAARGQTTLEEIMRVIGPK